MLHDADLLSVQQARDLCSNARKAMRQFQFASQEEVDQICEAMVAAAMAEAGRLGQMAHDETGFGYPAHKKLKNEFAASNVWESIKEVPTCGIHHAGADLKVVGAGGDRREQRDGCCPLGDVVMDAEVGAVHADGVGVFRKGDGLMEGVVRPGLPGTVGVEGVMSEAKESKCFHAAILVDVSTIIKR